MNVFKHLVINKGSIRLNDVTAIRTLICPPKFVNVDPCKTVEEVILQLTANTVGKKSHYDPKSVNRPSSLIQLLPESQDSLPHRKMMDSFDDAIIPLSSNLKLRDKYVTLTNRVRVGRLLEDMDVFSVHLAFKHIDNPFQGDSDRSPYSIVTALVDRIDIKGGLRADEDIKISGQVTWVGKSSMQVELELHQKRRENEIWELVTNATFVMVARNSTNSGSAFVNPLLIETEVEKEYFEKGAQNNISRKALAKKSLFGQPPSPEETRLIHDFFIQSLDSSSHLTFKARVKPENSVWMEDAKLKTVILCHPENRNRFNKIFGGFIMRQASELAWVNAYVYTGGQSPTFKHIDDIIFKNPVELGSVLYFNSQVAYTRENDLQVRVSAEIFDPLTKKSNLTNVFEYTLEVEKPVSVVIPKTYHEAMMYLNSRRHYLNSTNQS